MGKLIIEDVRQEEHDFFIASMEKMYASDSVIEPVPKSHFEDVFAEIMAKNPLTRGLIIKEKEEDGTLKNIGYLFLSFYYSVEAGGPAVLLEEIYISEQMQGKGIGHQVLDWVLAEYAETAKAIVLEVVPEKQYLKDFYGGHGFKNVSYQSMRKLF